MQSYAIYFSRRASEERVAARSAASSTAREAHLAMAERYAELATALDAREPILAART